jgi:EKC/KEOPS complex subunit CGI121/TPRKB
MSNVQTFHLAHLPEDLAIHVALYKDLKNASFFRQQLISGNTDFEYAFIDASMVCQASVCQV